MRYAFADPWLHGSGKEGEEFGHERGTICIINDMELLLPGADNELHSSAKSDLIRLEMHL